MWTILGTIVQVHVKLLQCDTDCSSQKSELVPVSFITKNCDQMWQCTRFGLNTTLRSFHAGLVYSVNLGRCTETWLWRWSWYAFQTNCGAVSLWWEEKDQTRLLEELHIFGLNQLQERLGFFLLSLFTTRGSVGIFLRVNSHLLKLSCLGKNVQRSTGQWAMSVFSRDLCCCILGNFN